MRKSVFAAALLALPLLAACGTDESSTAPTTLAPVSSAPVTTSPGATTAPLTSGSAPKSTTKSDATTPGAVPSGALAVPIISQSLQDKGGLDAKTADCVAKIYVDEDLSQNGLTKIIEKGNTNNPAELGLSMDDLRKAASAATRVVKECS
ncbi:hypothetical protein [Nocardia sp. NPDC057668]|uniref:hypothetical protein n=1 Tax=Nocardia sp. NPDC057668 TaxID=3346202 RepID=UPI0036731DBD